MNAAVASRKIESVLSGPFRRAFERHEKQPAEILSTGVAEFDRLLLGCPRGAITELHGKMSSGRTSLLLSTLAQATAREETCALIDCSDTFDLSSATNAEVDFERLLWVRCGDNLERAFKAVDLLLHGGGFGFIALILNDVPAKAVRRIISSWWFRFRRAIENTPTVLMVITPVACVRSCAALVLELKQETVVWPETLSLVSETDDGAFTKQAGQLASHLSLVNAAVPQSSRFSSLSNARFLQQLCLNVNRERPLEWHHEALNFQAILW
jgi:RecA/RadA recombinase